MCWSSCWWSVSAPAAVRRWLCGRVVVADARLVLGLPNSPPLTPLLGEPGSAERWQQLQQWRRGRLPLDPLVRELANGTLDPQPDVLELLWERLDREAVERLLSGPLGRDPGPWLAARRVLLQVSCQAAVQQAWLVPLLAVQQRARDAVAPGWLELLGHFRDPRVAQQLRQALGQLSLEPQSLEALLPLLGQQRQSQDAAALIRWALNPGPLAVRRAALEGLALGLSAWPVPPLKTALLQLAEDLDPSLAAAAVDLLARLGDAQVALRRLAARPLAPMVASRLQRRLRRSPLLLVVHGRHGGLVPPVYGELAQTLAERRGAPVLIQALSGEPPEASGRFWWAGRQAGQVTLVPLLLFPGEHVRRDLPLLAATWRARAPLCLRRRPFLGAWPAWQALLREVLAEAAAAAGHPHGRLALHHPLQGPLPARFLRHLEQVLGWPLLAAPYQQEPAAWATQLGDAALLAPLTLAANRLSESLNMGTMASPTAVLPPLLDLQPVREFLLASLEALP